MADELMTLDDMAGGKLDLNTLKVFANGDENTVNNPRLRPNADVGSIAELRKKVFLQMPFNAQAFKTKTDLSASALADNSFAFVHNDDTDSNNGLYQKVGGVWTYQKWNPYNKFVEKLNSLIAQTNITADYVSVFTDPNGYVVLGFKPDGSVHATKLLTTSLNIANSTVATVQNIAGYVQATIDKNGNIVMGVTDDGYVHIPLLRTPKTKTQTTVNVENSDAILFIGDSYTASHFTLKDKAYISNLSALLPFRLKNLAISGDESLDMTARIVNDIAYFDGLLPQSITARYAVIASYTNDWQYYSTNIGQYKANLSRLVQSIKALGIEPILSTEFPVSATAMQVIRTIAREQGIRFIDSNSLNNETSGLKVGIFHQGHPGTRTNGVFWLPMFAELSKLQVKNSIKIYRKRSQFVVSTIADLLYKNDIERYKKFKEISVSHQRLADTNAEYYDELDSGANVAVYTATKDEYLNIIDGSGVTMTDYALIELTVDGNAQTLDELTINIATDAQVYIRNVLDKTAAFAGRKAGTLPTDQAYIDNYNKPVGAWQLFNAGTIKLIKSQLKGLMLGDKVQILLVKTGAFTISNVNFSYVGGGKNTKYLEVEYRKISQNLLVNSTFDDLSKWTGTAKTLVPIDNYNSPRLPTDRTKPVNRVAVVDNTDKAGQTITLPKTNARYKLTVWSRYFAKAFLDNSKYQLDASQVIDKSTGNVYPTNAEITSDTADLRNLVLRYAFDTTLTDANAVQAKDFVALMWRGVEFVIDVPDTPIGSTNFTFDLSCDDGQIQIAKITLEEIV